MRRMMIAVTTVALFAATAMAADKTKIVFVAGKPSHGPGEHEHRAGSMLLANALNENMPNVEAVVVTDGWPADPAVFDGAASVVMYSDGGGGHPLNANIATFQPLVDKGVGLVCIHYAVETTQGEYGDKFLEYLGGYFEVGWSVNPHWTADFTKMPAHPIARGVPRFEINDEWYFHMRFAPGIQFGPEGNGVTPILTALPPMSTLDRADGSRSGNPTVRAAIQNGEVQHMAWAFERPNGGRGFGFTGGHFHRNWQNDHFRKVVLNAIVWTAKLDVPEGGVPSKTPTDEEMKANLDEKR